MAQQAAPAVPATPKSSDGDVSVMTFPSPAEQAKSASTPAPAPVAIQPPPTTPVLVQQPANPSPAAPVLAPAPILAAIPDTPALPAVPAAPVSVPARVVATPAVAIPAKPAPILPSTRHRHQYQYNSVSMDQVLADLMRDFRDPIVLTATRQVQLSGLYAGETIEDVLKQVCRDAEMAFERRDRTIYVTDPMAPAFPRTTLADISSSALVEVAQEKPAVTQDVLTPVEPAAPVAATAGSAEAPKPLKVDPKERKSGLAFAGIFKKDDSAAFSNLAQRRSALLIERNTLLLSAP
jgi:hypothetical protein